MTDSQDKSDDLIAELAKLMASGASSGEEAPKPTVIKLPPLNEATIKAAPVRIPGMDAPSPAAAAPQADRKPVAPAAASPSVRIPGMERPVGVSDGLPTAPAPRPGSQFDFGKPPAPSAITPEPMTNWQSREVPKPAPAPAAPQPASTQPPVPPSGARIEPVRFQAPVVPPVTQVEPKVAAAAPSKAVEQPAPPPGPSSAKAADDDKFDFNFGFDSNDAASAGSPDHDADDDPIADLIAADLDNELKSAAVDEDDAQNDDDDEQVEDLPPIIAAAPRPAPTPQAPNPAPQAPNMVQVKPVSVPSRQHDSERYAVTPTFTTPKPAPSEPPLAARREQPVRDEPRDPMDEIESLIGEAVRVELDPPPSRNAPQAAAIAPVVPPLNTGFAPRRSGLREKDENVESAEAAIMAAAGLPDIDADDVDAPSADDRPYKRMKVKPPRTSGIPSGVRQYVGIAVAGTLLLASGFGLYWVLGMGSDNPATAPVLTADASPVKVEPVVPPASNEPVSGSVVFDEIDGVAANSENEALVSRDETAGATVSEVARVTPVATTGDGSAAENGLANRKVRTVTVRPDGTIVSGDDSVAGTAELPVDRPNVPVIPGALAEPSDLLAAVADTRTSTEAAATEAGDNISALVAGTLDGADAALNSADPIEVSALLPSTGDSAATFDGSLVAPVPMPRPVDRTGLVGDRTASLAPSAPSEGGGIRPAASTPLTSITSNTQPAAAAPAPVRSAPGAYVQLSSQRSEGDANASMRAVQSQLGGLLSSPLEVRRVDLGAKGIWYRVVMPTNSFRDATQNCATIKANGGDCVAING